MLTDDARHKNVVQCNGFGNARKNVTSLEMLYFTKFFKCKTLQNEIEVKIKLQMSVLSVNKRRDIDNSQSNSNVLCNICGRGFTTNRGLLLHLNACWRKQGQENQQLEKNDDQANTHRLQDMPRKPVKRTFLLEQEARYNLYQRLKQRVWLDCLLEKRLVSSPNGSSGEKFYQQNNADD